jgi:hypothetical protein
MVALPDDDLIQRWSLKTFEREANVRVPVEGTVTALAMGSASRGPLYVGVTNNRRGAAHFLDPATFKEIPVKVAKGQLPGDGAYVRASADGRVFAMRNGVGSEPHSVTTVTFTGEKSASAVAADIVGSVVIPSPDGKFVHTAAAVYTSELKVVHPKNPPTSFAKPFVPAANGNYYMRMDYKEWDKLGGSIAFFLEGSERPVAQLAGVEGVSNEQIAYGGNRDTLTPDRRVFFFPDAKLVVTIPGSNDKLILYHFDVEKELEKSGVDYLLVTSRPVTEAVKGQPYRYEMVVKAKKGGVKCKLDAGPEGMKATPDGKLTWDVPKNFADATVDVILTVSDSSGQEVFHTFKIAVRDKADAPR